MVWFSLANLYRASNGGDFFINLTMHSSVSLSVCLVSSGLPTWWMSECVFLVQYPVIIMNLVLGMLFSQIQANKIIIHIAIKWKRHYLLT